MVALSAGAQAAKDTFASLPAADKQAAADAIRSANPDLFPKSDTYRFVLWVILLSLLAVLALACIGVALVLIQQGKDTAALFVVVGAVVSGMIGLFAKSPVTN